MAKKPNTPKDRRSNASTRSKPCKTTHQQRCKNDGTETIQVPHQERCKNRVEEAPSSSPQKRGENQVGNIATLVHDLFRQGKVVQCFDHILSVRYTTMPGLQGYNLSDDNFDYHVLKSASYDLGKEDCPSYKTSAFVLNNFVYKFVVQDHGKHCVVVCHRWDSSKRDMNYDTQEEEINGVPRRFGVGCRFAKFFPREVVSVVPPVETGKVVVEKPVVQSSSCPSVDLANHILISLNDTYSPSLISYDKLDHTFVYNEIDEDEISQSDDLESFTVLEDHLVSTKDVKQGVFIEPEKTVLKSVVDSIISWYRPENTWVGLKIPNQRLLLKSFDAMTLDWVRPSTVVDDDDYLNCVSFLNLKTDRHMLSASRNKFNEMSTNNDELKKSVKRGMRYLASSDVLVEAGNVVNGVFRNSTNKEIYKVRSGLLRLALTIYINKVSQSCGKLIRQLCIIETLTCLNSLLVLDVGVQAQLTEILKDTIVPGVQDFQL